MGFKLTIGGAVKEIEIVGRRPNLVLRVDGRLHEISGIADTGEARHSVTVDGTAYGFARASQGERQFVRIDGRTYEAKVVDPRDEAEAAGGGLDHVKAPMPGAVVSVHKRPGDPVARGETLVTIESMKLQTALGSPRDGVVARITKAEGETFEKDEIIVDLEPLAEGA